MVQERFLESNLSDKTMAFWKSLLHSQSSVDVIPLVGKLLSERLLVDLLYRFVQTCHQGALHPSLITSYLAQLLPQP